MVERPLCMRKVRGSIPLTSKFFWSHDYKGDSLAGGGILLIGSFREETGEVTILFTSHTNFGFSKWMMRYGSVYRLDVTA